MASSGTSESDSLPVSSAVQAQRCYKSQSRQLKNEGEIFFRAPHLYALPLVVAITLQNCFLRACTLCTPPSTKFLRSTPEQGGITKVTLHTGMCMKVAMYYCTQLLDHCQYHCHFSPRIQEVTQNV